MIDYLLHFNQQYICIFFRPLPSSVAKRANEKISYHGMQILNYCCGSKLLLHRKMNENNFSHFIWPECSFVVLCAVYWVLAVHKFKRSPLFALIFSYFDKKSEQKRKKNYEKSHRVMRAYWNKRSHHNIQSSWINTHWMLRYMCILLLVRLSCMMSRFGRNE